MRLLALLTVLISSTAWSAPEEIFWEDLVPKNYIAPQTSVNHDGSMLQQHLDAPLVDDFNGKVVKIPGFVVPLEGNADATTAFLLVPYFGACIHVPPPPPNQIVYVKFSQGVPIDNISDAIWVVGTLSTEGWQGEIATVGYTLTGIKILPFDG